MLSDSVVRASSAGGYYIKGHATLVRCRAEQTGGVGLLVGIGAADSVVSAVDFVAVANGIYGAEVTTGPSSGVGHSLELNLDRAMVSNNLGGGVVSDSGGGVVNVRVSNSTVTSNGGCGFTQQSAAHFGSMINNLVAGNSGGCDTIGTISPLTAH